MSRYYLQAPTGECVYVIENETHQSTTTGEIGTPTHLGNNRYRHLILTTGAVDVINSSRVVKEPCGTYTLDDKRLASILLPVQIKDAQYAELDDDLQTHYHREMAESTLITAIPVADHIPIEAARIPDGGLPKNWQPSALTLIYGPQFSAAMPGWLSGFRQHIKTTMSAHCSDVWDHQSKTSMEFNIRAFYDPPRTKQVKVGRRQETRQTWMTHRLTLDVADLIPGADLAAATGNWEQQTADILATIHEYSQTRTCSHCDGRGFMTVEPAA